MPASTAAADNFRAMDLVDMASLRRGAQHFVAALRPCESLKTSWVCHARLRTFHAPDRTHGQSTTSTKDGFHVRAARRIAFARRTRAPVHGRARPRRVLLESRRH